MKPTGYHTNITAIRGLGILVLLLILFGAQTAYRKANHTELINELYNKHLPAILDINDLEHESGNLRSLTLNLSSQRNDVYSTTTQIKETLEHITQIIIQTRQHLLLHPDHPELKTILKRFAAEKDTYAAAFRKLSVQDTSNLSKDYSALVQSSEKLDLLTDALNKAFRPLIHLEHMAIQESDKKGNQNLLIISIAILILASLVSYWTVIRLRAKEKALLSEQHKVNQLFEKSALPLYLTDYDGNILMVNEMGVEHVGYTREELLKMKIWDLDADHNTLEDNRKIWHQVSKEKQNILESRHRTKSGEIKEVEISFSTIEDDTGQLFMCFVKDITEIKNYTDRLQKQERRLQLALDGTRAAIWDWDLVTNKISIDQRWAELIGYKLEELQPTDIHTWRKHTHPDDLKKANKLLERHLEGKSRHYECRIRMRHKSGHWIWIWDRGKITDYDKNGQPLRLTGTHSDIQDMILYENALAENEAKYKFISESMPHMLWVMDESFNVTYLNKHSKEVLAIDSNFFKFDQWDSKVHPDDLPGIIELLEKNSKEKTQFEHVARLKNVDDEYEYYKIINKPMLSPSREITNWVGMGLNVNEDKLYEQKITESEARFRALVNAFNDLIFTVDTELRNTGTFGKGLQTLELDPENLLGKKPAEFLPPDRAKLMEDSMAEALQSGYSSVEWDAQDLNGNNRYFHTSYNKISDHESQTTGLLGVTRDITIRKTSEIKLQDEKDKQSFLAEKGRVLIALSSKNEIFDYVNDVLEKLLPKEAIFLINDYTIYKGHYQVMRVGGNSHLTQQISQELGTDIIGLKGPIDEKIFNLIRSGKMIDLNIFEDHILNDYYNQLPDSFKDFLKNYTIKSIALKQIDTLYGNVIFIIPKTSPFNADLISSLINLTSSVLEKINTLHDLETSKHELQVSQKHLEESRNKYQLLVDTAPIILYEYDYKGVGLFYSQNVEEILGYSKEELFEQPKIWKAQVHRDDLHLLDQAEEQHKSGKSFEISYRIKHKDGSWRWFRDISINHASKDGFIRGMVFDITREKQLSLQIDNQLNSLAEQQLKLKLATNSAFQGIVDWDLTTDQARLNRNAAIIIGTQELQVNQFTETFPDLLSCPQLALEGSAASKDGSFSQEVKLEVDGQPRWIRSTGVIVERSNDGTPKRMIGSLIDISAIKLKEVELQEKNKQLSLIIDNTPGVIFSCKYDQHYTMTFISDFIANISGYEAKEFIQNQVTFKSIIHPDDLRMVDQTMKEADVENTRFNLTYRIITKDKQIRWLTEVGEFQKHNKATQEIDGIIFDITENIAAEEQKLSNIVKSTDAERRQLASEIHDNIQQTMVTAYFNFESLKKNQETLSDKQKNRLEIGLNALNQSIADTRSLAHSLMPKQIEDFGLSESMEQLIDQMNNSDTSFSFYFNKKKRYDSNIEINLYRITQEALNNIRKHANAKEVFVQLTDMNDYLTLTIEDDGLGFNPKSIDIIHSGFGIQSMKSRAISIGATFDLTSYEGNGTFITVELPLNSHD